MNFNVGSENSVEHANTVVATNYFGAKNMIQAMIPLMKPSPVGARIVNVSSRLGRLNGRRNVGGRSLLSCSLILVPKSYSISLIAEAWRRRVEGAIRGRGVSFGGSDRPNGDEVRAAS